LGALVFGLTVMMMIQIFGHISYAIINPSIVITAVVNKVIDIKMAVMYVAAQCIGAILGYGLLYSLTPDEYFFMPEGSPGLCVNALHPKLSVVQAFFTEFFITAILSLVVSGVWDPRNKDNQDSAGIKIGLYSMIR
jgi:aquaporin related protein